MLKGYNFLTHREFGYTVK